MILGLIMKIQKKTIIMFVGTYITFDMLIKSNKHKLRAKSVLFTKI